MEINIQKVNKSQKHVNICVYGRAGIGKTVLCTTAESPLIISAEGGLLSIQNQDIDFVEIKKIEDMQAIFEFLNESEDAKKYKTICIDSISEIAEVMLSQYKGVLKDPRQAYGSTNDEMVKVIRALRDIPYHTYFSAKETRIKDDFTGVTTYAPSMPGKTLVNGLSYYFDEVCPLRLGEDEEGNSYRYLQTQPTITHEAKDRSGKLREIEKPDIKHVIKRILKQPKGDK